MKIKNKKIILSLGLIILGVFFNAHSSNAVWGLDYAASMAKGGVLTAIGWIAQLFVWMLGAVISAIIWAVIHLAQYNNFINEPAIKDAWIIIRDFCNMLFILILLVIAFTTILRMDGYNWKKMLPKLLIMAVLINFSRTIIGLIIDFSQIFMLTFINAIGNSGGNYMSHLGVQDYLQMVSDTKWGDGNVLISTVGGIILGVVFLAIAAVVMLVLLGVIAMRIVMLWIYIVLSPLAFLLSAFPAGQKYSSQWWDRFTKEVITGPVLAFFIWLSLIASAQITSLGAVSTDAASQCFGPSKILCPDKFTNFIIAIGMLIGGLIVTQQIGGAAGGIAGKGMARIQKGKGWVVDRTKRVGKSAGVWAGQASFGAVKGIDAAYGARGAKAIQAIKSRGGAGIGAAVGGVAGIPLGPIGSAIGVGIGAAVGGYWGKNIEGKLDLRRKILDAQTGLKKEKVGGEEVGVINVEGEKYGWKDKAFHKIKNGQFTEEKLQGAFLKKEVKEMTEEGKKFWLGYSSLKRKGWGAKEAAGNEQINKFQSEYKGMSVEMLKRLIDVEQDANKKAAIALELAVKNGIANVGDNLEKKKIVSVNSIAAANYDDAINKKNLLMNSTEADGTINKDKINSAFSSGKAKIEDQDFGKEGLTPDHMLALADVLGSKFGKSIESAISAKTDKDKAKMLDLMKNTLGRDKSEPIRDAYAEFTGKIQEGFKDNKEAMVAWMSKMEPAKIVNLLSKSDEKELDNDAFVSAFAEAVKGVNTLKAIIKSDKVTDDKQDKLLRKVASKNADLKKKMENDNELKKYV